MKLIKRKPKHENERCQKCGYKIKDSNGEFVYKMEQFEDSYVHPEHVLSRDELEQ